MFEAEAFDVDFSDQNVDLLSRTKMIGEYFQCDWNKTIQIFDADEDAFKTISFNDAAGHALNANDKKFQHTFIDDRKHSHFIREGDDGEETKAVNELRNDAKWKPAIEKAYQDELKPRVRPEQFRNLRAQSPQVVSRAVEILQAVNAEYETLFSYACRNLTGDDMGYDTRNVDGDTFPNSISQHAAQMLRLNLREACRRHRVTPTPNAVFDADLTENFGFGSDQHTNAVAAVIDSVNTIKAKASFSRQDAVDLATVMNTLHEGEDYYKLMYAIVTDINYNAHKSVLIFRPFSTWRMGSAIIAQGGTELGSTFHGHHDFQLSDDVVRKTILGHYTFYSKAVVKRPKHYCIEEDVHCQGYVSGSGTQFFTHDTLREAVENQTIGTDQNRHDLVAWIVDDGEDYSKPIHMSGALPMTMADYDDGKDHFSGCRAMQQILADMGASADYADDDSYMGGNNNLNYLCFHGAQKEVLADGSTRVTHLNKGHWGELTYDGCMGIRTGEMVEKNAKAVLRVGEK